MPRSGVPTYSCTGQPGTGSCGRVSVRCHTADEHVLRLLLEGLDNPELVERLTRPAVSEADLYARIRDDEDQLEQLATDWAAHEITRGEWKTARAVIETRLAAARNRLDRQSRTTALSEFVGTYEQMEARWEAMNTVQRRAVVTAAIESITVTPAAGSTRRRGYDPASRFADPVWRV